MKNDHIKWPSNNVIYLGISMFPLVTLTEIDELQYIV